MLTIIASLSKIQEGFFAVDDDGKLLLPDVVGHKKWFAIFSGWEHLMGFNLVEKNLAQNSQMSTCVLCSCLFPRYGVFFSAKKGNLPYGFVTMDFVLL